MLSNKKPAGGLLPSFEFPAAPKAKSIYFLKKNGKVPLAKKELHQQLTFGDLSSNPLQQLSVIVDNVSGSLISPSHGLLLRSFSKAVIFSRYEWAGNSVTALCRSCDA